MDRECTRCLISVYLTVVGLSLAPMYTPLHTHGLKRIDTYTVYCLKILPPDMDPFSQSYVIFTGIKIFYTTEFYFHHILKCISPLIVPFFFSRNSLVCE